MKIKEEAKKENIVRAGETNMMKTASSTAGTRRRQNVKQ